jgi:hypothetical protein
VTAASLLLKTAQRKGHSLTVVEWPGGEPETIDLKVADNVIGSTLRGANRVPVADPQMRDVRKFGTLPWGSTVRLVSDQRELGIISGPVRLSSRWFLPIIGPQFSKPTDTVSKLHGEGRRLRKALGYHEQRV